MPESDQRSSECGVELPKWLTVEFIEKHLRNHYANDKIKVCKFEVKLPSANGENFSSLIYRVKVGFTGHSTKPDEVIILNSIEISFISSNNLYLNVRSIDRSSIRAW